MLLLGQLGVVGIVGIKGCIMNALTENKNKLSLIDYFVTSLVIILLFITKKGVIPVYIYGLFITLIAFYFFPIKLLVESKQKTTKRLRTLTVVNGVIFSLILVFSLLRAYVPDGVFAKNFSVFLGFTNFGIIFFWYIKHNQFLLLNFIFTLVISLGFI